MSGVFQNIDPPTPSPPSECGGGGTHSPGGEGVGVNILENARHCSVLYIRKYFVDETFSCRDRKRFNTSLDIFGTVFL
jgi:hypothetical protein